MLAGWFPVLVFAVGYSEECGTFAEPQLQVRRAAGHSAVASAGGSSFSGKRSES